MNLEVKYKNSHCGTHNFEVKTKEFEAEVKIAHHGEMVYVRQILASKGGEKLNGFQFKNDLENTMVVLYNQGYWGKLK